MTEDRATEDDLLWASAYTEGIDREWDVIACCMYAPELLPQVLRVCSVADFANEDTAMVFNAIVRLNERRQEPDALAVSRELREMEADANLILEAMDADRHRTVPANAVTQARYIRFDSLARRLRAFGSKLAEQRVGGSPTEWIAQAEKELRALGDEVTIEETAQFDAVVSQLMTRIDEGHGLARGVPTGFPTLDAALGGGLTPSRSYIVAARSGIGKTSFACNVALRFVQSGRRVLFVSLEMEPADIVMKMMADATNSQINSLYDPHRFAEAMEATGGWSTLEIMHGRKTVNDVETRVREMRREGLDLVVVDYLQLVRPSSRRDNRTVEVSEISNDLKLLAMENQVPLLVLSQLRRPGAGHTDTKPSLYELRESGAIENDADAVLLLHRDRLADPFAVEATLAKNRYGEERRFDMRFLPQIGRFEEGA